jgi:DNA-binding MarR family transcriptional regulator
MNAEQASSSAPHLEPAAEVYRAEAELRTALRHFERKSEQLARAQGLTPRQYALLLLIKGAPNGSERATVTDLSQRLQLNQSTVTELVQRAVEAGLLQRTPSPDDARSHWLSLTPDGSQHLAALIAELGSERQRLAEVLRSLGTNT